MNKPLINDILCAIWRYLPRHFFSTRPIRPIAQANFATNAGAQRHDFDYRRLVAASGSSWEVNCWVHHHHISWGDNMMSRFRYTELYIYICICCHHFPHSNWSFWDIPGYTPTLSLHKSCTRTPTWWFIPPWPFQAHLATLPQQARLRRWQSVWPHVAQDKSF